MGPITFVIQEFILGGLIIYHPFTLGQNVCPLKNMEIFFRNQWKMAKYTGCPKIIYCPTSNALLAVCEWSSSKTDATFSNQF